MNKRDLMASVRETGSHFFDAATMRFFRSRLETGGTPARDGASYLFITSEQFVGSDGVSAPREYKLRRFTPDKGQSCCDTVSEHASLADAKAALKVALK